MNTITVRISGVDYNLKGDEPEEYLHKVARYVDKKMQDIMDNNNMLSSSSACVLTAINATDEMFKAQAINGELSANLKQSYVENTALDDKIEAINKEIEIMRNANMELQKRLNSSEEAHRKSEEESTSKLTKEMDILQQTAEKYISECAKLRAENKEMKFQIQSSKYKIIDLEQKLIDNQINLAVEKKQKNAVNYKR